jgi:6-pyruvoyltetrahydropterin/6-carboxytetrahydropterin synthase
MTSPVTVLVSRRETFNAAHQLRNPRLSDDENRRLFGKCVNLHGHNYALDVVVAGKIDDASGYVLDLKRLSDVMYQQIIEHVDHRNLNTDVPWLEGLPRRKTSQYLLGRLKRELPQGSLRSVRVSGPTRTGRVVDHL